MIEVTVTLVDEQCSHHRQQITRLEIVRHHHVWNVKVIGYYDIPETVAEFRVKGTMKDCGVWELLQLVANAACQHQEERIG